MLGPVVVAVAVLLPGTACGRSGSPVDASPQSLTRSEKPEAPVTLHVGTIAPARLGQRFQVVATASPGIAVGSLSLTVHFAGVVRRANVRGSKVVWRSVPAGQSRRLAIAAIARHVGTGALTITARVVAGNVAQTRTVVVDVLAAADQVLAGTSGLQQLQLHHLDHELATGRISRAEYETQKARVLGGGATEGP